MEKKEFLSPTFLDGKYNNLKGFKVEINSGLSFACFENKETEECYTFQGDEANNVINEINYIYNVGDCTQDEAISRWINAYI